MSKAVLISIRPKWCALIANGKKTIEVRKTAPKIDTPFKSYIYCTRNGRPLVYGDVSCADGWTEKYTQTYGYNREEADKIWGVMNGTVIGEFVCDGIQDIIYRDDGEHQHYQWIDAPAWAFFLNQKACLTDEELKKYLTTNDGYGWHISDLVIYNVPKELSEFTPCCKFMLDEKQCDYRKVKCLNQQDSFMEEDGCNCLNFVRRPPQSWCYVEELP